MLVSKDKTAPAANLKRRKWGLEIPKHIKVSFIWMNMSFIAISISQYTLLVSNGAIILPLLLIPSWALAIAYRLPIDCLLLALSIGDRYGPDPAHIDRQSIVQAIGNRSAIDRQ